MVAERRLKMRLDGFTLMFYGYRYLKVEHSTRFSQGRFYISGLEGFWSFAKERLIKHHGISPNIY